MKPDLFLKWSKRGRWQDSAFSPTACLYNWKTELDSFDETPGELFKEFEDWQTNEILHKKK